MASPPRLVRSSIVATLAVLSLHSMSASAAESLRIPPLTGPVMDEVGIIDAGSYETIQNTLITLHREGKVQMQVYVPQSLQDLPIEEFTIRVAESWRLGRKGDDKGLLLVIAPNERKMRFEVGYGLEGSLTDAFTKHVLDDVMKPYFQEKRYGDGIIASISEIVRKLGVDIPVSTVSPPRSHESNPSGLPPLTYLALFLLVPFVFFLVFLQMYAERSQRGRFGRGGGWGGGGFGGGVWGGGGGGFGGGGSSSSW